MPTPRNLKTAGTVASLLFYERFRGLYIASAKKTRIHYAINKGVDTISGNSNRIAKQACGALSRVSQLPVNKDLVQRLAYSVQHCFANNSAQHNESMRYMPLISGFRFNTETSLNQKLETNIEVDWQSKDSAKIKIPEINPRLDIIAPARTLNINLKFISVCIPADMKKGTQFLKALPFMAKSNQEIQIPLPYIRETVAAKEMQLPINIQPGCLHLIIASLEYITRQNGKLSAVSDRKWMPADIVSAVFVK